jgi:hypothetical protein
MPQRTEAGARLFGVLEEMGWTHGDSVRLAPLVRTLRRRGVDVTTGQPPPPPPPRHPLDAVNRLDPVDDVRVKERREQARRYRDANRRAKLRMRQ